MFRGYRDIVKTNRGYVLVDSRETFDMGYETMVFKCNERGQVDIWLDIDVARYPTYAEMGKGHACMVDKWKEI